ncbi:MAG: homoserine dehydrogenase [Cellvibrionaceae bacterium]|nr:homoserine dehydrogenase [Cellvibrionaceae bacterium]
MESLKVGICGLGTVGGGTFDVLTRNAEEIAARIGCRIQVSHIASRRAKPQYELSGLRFSEDVFAVCDDPDVDIVVELIGGTSLARELVSRAISRGKHVVTANKALIAEYGGQLFAEAVANKVTIAFEAAVAGGIPIIGALREGLAANRVHCLAGIINGTTNFILTEMRDKGRDFADVLKEAQALGYAEADPTFDIEGIDAAHKLVILASIAFGIPLQCDKVFNEGIGEIQPIDVHYASELGYNIKHLGLAVRRDQGVELRVHPTLVPKSQLIANVDGVMNAVLVKGDAVGATLYCGAGAGAEPTASSVIADIVHIARSVRNGRAPGVPHLGFANTQAANLPILPIEDIESSYYLRMSAEDKPGVLSQVCQVLSEAGISIEALVQREPQLNESQVPVILLTNIVRERDINSAIAKIHELESIHQQIVKIRLEALG